MTETNEKVVATILNCNWKTNYSAYLKEFSSKIKTIVPSSLQFWWNVLYGKNDRGSQRPCCCASMLPFIQHCAYFGAHGKALGQKQSQ
jgi:hypothetical protein